MEEVEYDEERVLRQRWRPAQRDFAVVTGRQTTVSDMASATVFLLRRLAKAGRPSPQLDSFLEDAWCLAEFLDHASRLPKRPKGPERFSSGGQPPPDFASQGRALRRLLQRAANGDISAREFRDLASAIEHTAIELVKLEKWLSTLALAGEGDVDQAEQVAEIADEEPPQGGGGTRQCSPSSSQKAFEKTWRNMIQ